MQLVLLLRPPLTSAQAATVMVVVLVVLIARTTTLGEPFSVGAGAGGCGNGPAGVRAAAGGIVQTVALYAVVMMYRSSLL